MADDYEETLIRQRVAEMSNDEFDQLIAETRPPRLDPKEAAAAALRRKVRGANVNEIDATTADDAREEIARIFGWKA